MEMVPNNNPPQLLRQRIQRLELEMSEVKAENSRLKNGIGIGGAAEVSEEH